MCDLTDMVEEYEAKLRFDAGEPPCFSSNVVDQVTCGYGKLSSVGEWQFPLRPANKYLRLTKQRQAERSEPQYVVEQPRESWMPVVYTIE